MKVKAALGLKCPMEGNPREYITDDPKGVAVPDTSYYQRLLDDGSLVLVPAKTTKGGDQ
jgi:hypothetical protein